jgi:hypothetical protein
MHEGGLMSLPVALPVPDANTLTLLPDVVQSVDADP